MKKLFTILILIIIFINAIIPVQVLGAAAPEEPPEMPDWFKEKYCKDDVQKCHDNLDDDIKGKKIKTIKKPTNLKNPTPVGIGFYLVSEFILKESETYREWEQNFWDTINYYDLAAAEYLHSKGIHGWDDIFEKVSVGSYQFSNKFIDAISDIFFHVDTNFDENIETMLDDLTNSFTAKYPNIILEQTLDFQRSYIVKSGFYRDKDTNALYFIVELLSVRDTFSDNKIRYKSQLYWGKRGSRLFSAANGGEPMSISGTNVTVSNPETIWEAREKVKPYYDDFVKVFEKPETNPNLDKFESLKGAILTNPFGSRLLNPSEDDFKDIQKGIIEIDNTPYHIVELPNPAHTPHLPSNDPNYVPEYYPIITPLYPDPDIYTEPKPLFPNYPEPTPQPSPEPTPQPSPDPSPQPSPEPSPDPSPEPSPDPSPEPSTPQIPRAPEDEFGEGKSCGELDLDLKSIELFTTKFPFSIPWDIFRALEAFFGKMGSEEPRFVLSFISDDVILELPEFIKEWIPLVRSLILLIFDVSVIYALYRWFGGAS